MRVLRSELRTSCAKPAQLPDTELPEFAFLGRSNVGKSSLLNALVRRRNLARTSATPGKTRLIHFFDVETEAGPLLFVDLPGYGFARVPRGERHAWRGLVEGYLDHRPNLRAAILLQDLRRDLSEDETLLLDWLAERDVFTVLAITKADKLKPMQRKRRLAELSAQLEGRPVAVRATSARTRVGLAELWQVLRERL